MAKYLTATIIIPVRESHESTDTDEILDAINVQPSDINESHTIVLNGEILVDSLVEVRDKRIIEIPDGVL